MSRLCKTCKIKPISSNGYCRECDPRPTIRRLVHNPEMSPNECIGRQWEEKLPDGRTLTVIYRESNYA